MPSPATMKSTRAAPAQPSARKAVSASRQARAVTSGESLAGTKYCVEPGVYLAT